MHDDMKYFDLYNAAFKESPLNPDAPNDLEAATNNIIVGAKQRPCTFKDLDSNSSNDTAFTNFRIRLAKFFNGVLKQEQLPNAQKLVLQQQDMVRFLFNSLSLIE